MKFDIVRAWKDASYRQNLSNEQLQSLPANPAGELNERELELVYGGQAGSGISDSAASQTRVHSFSFECDENDFSDNEIDLQDWARLTAILSPTNQVCVNDN